MSAARIQEAITEALDLHVGRHCYGLISRKTIEDISEINKRITKLRSTRDKLAHFCWCRWDDEQLFGMNFSGGLPGTKKHGRSHVKIRISEANALHQEFCEIVEKLSQIAHALPELDEKGIKSKLKYP